MKIKKSEAGAVRIFEAEFSGRPLKVEIGKIANQTDGSCTVQFGETVVLATAVVSQQPREGVDFFPLMVDYEERLYAAGKIKGSRWIKREGRPSDEAVLTARLIDRSIRPLFDDRIKNDIQVVLTVLSYDGQNDPDFASIMAASIALSISKIPWNGPIGGLRIGRVENQWIVNPTAEQAANVDLDLFVAAKEGKIVMIETDAKEAVEPDVYSGMEQAVKHIDELVNFVQEITKVAGEQKLAIKEFVTVTEEEVDDDAGKSEKELTDITNAWLTENVEAKLFAKKLESKESRKEVIRELAKELEAHLVEKNIGKERRKKAMAMFKPYVYKLVSQKALTDTKRVDGRKIDEIRELKSEVSLLPRTHGSGLFSRGQTQILSVVTLGSPGDEQLLEGIEESGKKRYMHHYNFPQFSVGETGPMRSPGRREIGHGALAEKALEPMLPSQEDFPYTIRVVSEVTSSNGSSSMGSVCGSTLALMDAGVPIKKAVAGIAMGLASDEQGNYQILTDLQDLEDGPGGMDFKIAGTKDGITAIQMDTKTDGLTLEIVKKTLEQGKTARLQILDTMGKAISEPRADLSEHAPRIVTININPEKIRDVIGPGGKVINEIIDSTGVQIDIEPDGRVLITSTTSEGSQKAVEWIENLTKEVTVGEIYKGKVARILDFGAFVELTPNQTGMVHISELADHRVNKVQDVVNIGDMVTVKVINIDEQGRINLSMKQAQESTGVKPPKGPRKRFDSFKKKRQDN